MGEIKGWHADNGGSESDVDEFINRIHQKSIREYGRQDVPGYVQRVAESYAIRKKVSNLKALNELVAEAGSFEVLLRMLLEKQKEQDKKFRKLARLKVEQAKKPKSSTGSFQRAVDASKKTKYVSMVRGGLPSLGKKAR